MMRGENKSHPFSHHPPFPSSARLLSVLANSNLYSTVSSYYVSHFLSLLFPSSPFLLLNLSTFLPVLPRFPPLIPWPASLPLQDALLGAVGINSFVSYITRS